MAIFKLNESNSFDDDQKVICKMAIDNGFISDMADSLQYSNMLEETDDGWAYMRSDYGGRDYFDDIPLEYIDEDEIQEILDYCLLDSDIEDYDWGEYSDDIELVQEALEGCFVDMLIDYLNGNPINESKKRRKVKESKEGKSDKSDLETLLTAVKETLDYFDYHNKNLTKKQDYILDDLKDVYDEIKRGR